MEILRLSDKKILDHTKAFPNSSIHYSKLTDEFLAARGFAHINLIKDEFDANKHKLVNVTPYEENGKWYSVTVEDLTPDELATKLAQAKDKKKAQVRSDFNRQSEATVEVNGVTWAGGEASGFKLDAARRLAQEGGLNSVTFFDATNTAHQLTIEEATQVVLAVGAKHQQDFAKKQQLFAEIEATTTIEQLDAIVIEEEL